VCIYLFCKKIYWFSFVSIFMHRFVYNIFILFFLYFFYISLVKLQWRIHNLEYYPILWINSTIIVILFFCSYMLCIDSCIIVILYISYFSYNSFSEIIKINIKFRILSYWLKNRSNFLSIKLIMIYFN
jgi:hypothetical protein